MGGLLACPSHTAVLSKWLSLVGTAQLTDMGATQLQHVGHRGLHSLTDVGLLDVGRAACHFSGFRTRS